ncbi:MAG TPA: acetyltransferase [Ignavibacteria bacterium]|nr:sugar O-acyltransferase [Bacteroidota bacterium]HRI84561.1 acetyltransferase [Ignavibacteria bacterium]HRJ98529.1 acetyltransferase [Ignavibacteria bacterium]
MKNKKVIIIGNTSNARLAKYFFDIDSEYETAAFSVNKKYISETEFEGLPVIPLEDIDKTYPPSEYEAFAAVGYTNMNKIREDLYNQCKDKGYRMANYISSRCSYLSQFQPGDNCFILEDNTIQPFVKIGNNVVLWSGNHIGHDVIIEDHNFITSHVVVSGFVTIKRNCFLGVNATIRDGITIAPETLIAAGAIIMKDTEEKGVYLPARSTHFDKKSDEIKIS